MIKRCDSDEPNYGGRGIKVSDEWRNFPTFIADMGTRPSKGYSIDRIDNNGNYCKENCRWATAKEQSDNKRDTIYIEVDGQRKTLQSWSAISGINPTTIMTRLDSGYPASIAIHAKVGTLRGLKVAKKTAIEKQEISAVYREFKTAVASIQESEQPAREACLIAWLCSKLLPQDSLSDLELDLIEKHKAIIMIDA